MLASRGGTAGITHYVVQALEHPPTVRQRRVGPDSQRFDRTQFTPAI